MSDIEWIEHNVNDFIKIDLTYKGKKVCLEYFGDPEILERKNDGDDMYVFTIWEMLYIFGDHIYNHVMLFHPKVMVEKS